MREIGLFTQEENADGRSMMKNYELDIGALKIAHETAFVFGAGLY